MEEYDILATGREDTPRFKGFSCGYTRLDVSQPDEIKRLFLDFAPDVVINCAAMTNVDACETEKEACWQANVTAVELLVRSCRSHGTRLIHVSTDFIFDGIDGPYNEQARPNPLSYYGKSKLAAENIVRTLPPSQWAIARTVLVFGSAQNLGRSNIVLWLMDQLRQGKQVNIITDQFRSPTYVHDLANGIESIIRYRKNGVYNLSGREYLSIYDFALKVAHALHFDPSLINPTDSQTFTQPAKRPPKTGFIILKAETELGFKPHSIEEAVLDLSKRLSSQND
jgi:dTDP-4-dehydrorhamnose reductase